MAGLILIVYIFEQATSYFVLDEFGNQIENEDGSYEMIEYDGYLDGQD